MNNKSTRINYVDIILFALAALIVAVFVFMNFSNNSLLDFSQKDSITLTLRVKNIPLKHSHLIKSGDTVFFADDEQTLGKVKYASYDADTVEFLDKLTNTSTIYKAPDKRTALLLVECDAIEADGIYTVADKALIQGDSIDAFVSGYSFSATIIKIESDEG